jgi:hypothetical protein
MEPVYIYIIILELIGDSDHSVRPMYISRYLADGVHRLNDNYAHLPPTSGKYRFKTTTESKGQERPDP